MDKEERENRKPDGEQRPSTTSPPGGKTWEATRPPGQGEVDEEATAKGWEALDRAGGGH